MNVHTMTHQGFVHATTYWQRTRRYITAHKRLSIFAVVVLLVLLWWFWGALFGKSTAPRYVLTNVVQTTIVASVSASGQVSANQQLDIKPEVSGQVVYVGVAPGQKVRAGTLVAEIDPSDAQKAVRDAQTNLDSAKLALAKLQEPADALTLTQAQNALADAQTALATDYQNGTNDVTNAFLDLPSIMTGIQNLDFGTDASGNTSQWNIDYYGTVASVYDPRGGQYRDDAYNAYQAARQSYDKTFADYKAAPPNPDNATIEKLLQETYDTSVLMQNAVKSTYTLIQFYDDQLTQAGKTPKTAAATHLSTLNSYTTKLNPHISSLLSDKNTLASDKQSITEKQQSLQKTQSGADPLDIQSAQLTVTQRQNALQDAEDTLAKYYIRAPFDGTIAAVPINRYDQAGSGSAVATLVTTSQYAELSLNEVDAAKIQTGDKATLTFDAIPDLTLTGTVAEIDPVGTVSQGVVSYDVKIGFDTQDARIKPGMTVNANIQSAVHQNVLAVPSSAVKTQSGQSYVLAFNPPLATTTSTTSAQQGIATTQTPERIPVETGISDDTMTEIVSGLSLGQQVVARTITAATGATANTTTRTGAGGFGGGGARGGVRIP